MKNTYVDDRGQLRFIDSGNLVNRSAAEKVIARIRTSDVANRLAKPGKDGESKRAKWDVTQHGFV